MQVAYNDSDDRAGLRGYVQFNKYTFIHIYAYSQAQKTNSKRVNDSTFFGPFLNNCCFVVVVAKLE